MLILVLFLLLFNYAISKIIVFVLIKTSNIVVENYDALKDYVTEPNYKHYLEINQDPSCLDKIWIVHIPFHNLYQLFVFARDMALYTEILINKKDF
jgi:hypothetical protein